MYGSQPPRPPPPPPSYYQYPSAPSQPQWQQNQPPVQPWSEASGPPPPPPPPPPGPPPPPQSVQPGMSFYNPSMYGPMPGSIQEHASQGGTASPVLEHSRWNAAYNQHQQQQQPSPTVPPRPVSSLSHPQMHSPAANTSSWTPSPPPASHPFYPPNPMGGMFDLAQPGHSFYGSNFAGNPQHAPAPPPVPPRYPLDSQQNLAPWPTQPTYSDHPPTHQYDPQQHQYQQQQLQQPPHQQQSPGPGQQQQLGDVMAPLQATQVIPKANYMHQIPATVGTQDQIGVLSNANLPLSSSPPVALNAGPGPPAHCTSTPPAALSHPPVPPLSSVPTASALGFGGPSDWEHYASTVDDVDDTDSYIKKHNPVNQIYSVELPPNNHVPPTNAVAPVVEEAESNVVSDSQTLNITQPVSPETPVMAPSAETNTFHAAVVALEERLAVIPSVHVASEATSTITLPKPAESAPIMTPEVEVTSPPKTTNEYAAEVAVTTHGPARTDTPVPTLQPTPQQSPTSVASKSEQQQRATVFTIADPYADLDPWYKSSLTRFVTMLRNEMVTESDEEKFKVYTSFMTKESRLRAILYGVEDAMESSHPKPLKVQPTKPSSGSDVMIKVVPDEGLSMVDHGTDGANPDEHTLPSFSSSPTGEQRTGADGLHRSLSHPTPPSSQNRANHKTDPVKGHSDSNSLRRTSLAGPPRSTSVPLGASSWTLGIKAPDSETSADPTRPAYVPFRYSEGPHLGAEPLTFDRPAYQAYSALRQASVESGRSMTLPTDSPPNLVESTEKPATTARGEHDETFLGLIRAKSVAYHGRQPGPKDALQKIAIPEFPRKTQSAREALDALRSLAPPQLPSGSSDDAQSASARRELDTIVDDFSFMDKSHEVWDRETNNRRVQLDNLRRKRQEESEHHIDLLFNDKEIGYSDINVLEEEFKQTEAQKQLNEERKEFDKYVEIVFNLVEKRLTTEIEAIQAIYDRSLGQLKAGNNANDLVPGPKLPKARVSQVMKVTIDSFHKLELRHVKRLDAALEKERRRKKAERRFFVFLGDTQSLKQVDKDFDMSEKRIILEAAKTRDERANRLMDAFDEASMGGLGENQRLLDDIQARMEGMEHYLNSGADVLPDALRILNSALDFVKFLGADSESILRSFGLADQFLNNADYNVSVSEARVSYASPEIFQRLEEEKKKEDRKIQDDLDGRIESVRNGHRGLADSIQGAIESIQKENPLSVPGANGGTNLKTPSTSSAQLSASFETMLFNASPSVEDQQQERLRIALEEAKKRNAVKSAT